jgi:hypothetical protein
MDTKKDIWLFGKLYMDRRQGHLINPGDCGWDLCKWKEPQKWHNIPSISFRKMRASKLPCVAQLHLGGGGGGGWVGTLDKQPQLKVGIMTPGQRWVWNLDGQTKLIKCIIAWPVRSSS